MTDKDRNAFNNWFLSPTRLPLENPYSADTATAFNAGFEAAHDHFAPLLTQKEAIEAAARSLAEIDLTARAELQKLFGESHDLPSVNESWQGYVHEAKAALRAAGVKFRDEA